jgi:hypothetical protein
MTLEHWDSRKQKYVLYWSTEQHSKDCTRFPFKGIPRRVFLDTNVISVLVKHSTNIFDHELIPIDTESTLAADVEALMHVFHVGAQANWDLLAPKKRSMRYHALGIAHFAAIFWSTRLEW